MSSGLIIDESLGDVLGECMHDLNKLSTFTLVIALRCAKPLDVDLNMV